MSGAAAETACGALAKPDPTATLPTGFPAVAGFTAVGTVRQGATTVIKGAVKGTPADIVKVRDAGFAALTAKGYTIGGHDQEPGAEADGDFTGQHPGNINVKPLCTGNLLVTYTFQ